MGRALDNAMLNVGLKDLAKGASLLASQVPVIESYLCQVSLPKISANATS